MLKNKTPSKSSKASKNDNASTSDEINLSDSFFEKLMSDPLKRTLVLQLLSQEKDTFKEKKRADGKKQNKNESPLKKVKGRHHCESPSALLRRRALEKQNQDNDTSENSSESDHSRSSSRQSVKSAKSPVPFEKLLEGVIAYVEVKSKDQDRSAGAKALMALMGATVRDVFTKDVTHVVFKDGSFTTYQKAKFLKAHLVSVLWIDAVRNNNARVPEKYYPALGTDAHSQNVSSICSQLQKEYEDVVRDEMRRSVCNDSTRTTSKDLLQNRRKTISNVRVSRSSSDSSDNSLKSCKEADKNMSNMVTHKKKLFEINESPEVTSDDSDSIKSISISRRKTVGGMGNFTKIPDEHLQDSPQEDDFIDVSQSLITPVITNRSKTLLNSDMELTNVSAKIVQNSAIKNIANYEVMDMDISNVLPELVNTKIKKGRRKKTNKLADINTNNNIVNVNASIPSDVSTNITDEAVLKRLSDLKQISKFSNVSSLDTDMPPLQISSDNSLLSKRANSSKHTSMSSLRLSSEKNNTANTNMSSLKITQSSENTKSKNCSITTNMSLLQISSENKTDTDNNDEVRASKNKSSSTDSSKCSFSPLDPNTVNNALKALDSPITRNVTMRKKKQRHASLNTSGDSSFNENAEKENVTDKSIDETPVFKRITRRSVLKSVDKNNEVNYTPKKSTATTFKTPKNKTPRKSLKQSNNKIKNIESPLTINEELSKMETEYSSPKSKTPRKSLKQTKNTIKNIKSPLTKNNELNDKNFEHGPVESKTPRKKVKQPKNKMKSPLTESSATKNEHSPPKRSKQTTELENNTQDGSSGSGGEKKKRLRKLYNPEDSINVDLFQISDEKERLENRKKLIQMQKKKNEEIANANIIPIAPQLLLSKNAKQFLDKQEVSAITNKKRSKSERTQNQAEVNDDHDEQKELASEFGVRKRRSLSEGRLIENRRKSVRQTQKPKRNLHDTSDEIRATPFFNRRSTLEFQSLSQSTKRKLKIDVKKQPSIVCTKLHRQEVTDFNQIVKKLGGFITEDEVSNKTTHLVAGEPKRTINMLRALATGCWILRHEWLLRSLEAGRWLPEEEFELTEFSPAVQQCRLQRQAFGPTFSMDIFQNCGPIYIAKSSTPRCSDLRELVAMCKGKVVTIERNAKIIVGEQVRQNDVICVNETWILDSITFNKAMSTKKYLINSFSPVV